MIPTHMGLLGKYTQSVADNYKFDVIKTMMEKTKYWTSSEKGATSYMVLSPVID